LTIPLAAFASCSHSGVRRWQYPHPCRQMFTNTAWGDSTTSFLQFSCVNATTLDENGFPALTDVTASRAPRVQAVALRAHNRAGRLLWATMVDFQCLLLLYPNVQLTFYADAVLRAASTIVRLRESSKRGSLQSACDDFAICRRSLLFVADGFGGCGGLYLANIISRRRRVACHTTCLYF